MRALFGLACSATVLAGLGLGLAGPARAEPFDHTFADYAEVLRAQVYDGRVDYRSLLANRAALDAVVLSFEAVGEGEVRGWPRSQQVAFWINAYNVFTLRAVVDHYRVRGGAKSRSRLASIRTIDGVWTALRWQAAGRSVTLDDIEHRILRPTFREPLVHFAINCASVSCPPLAVEPYRGDALDAQLVAAARRYLADPLGLVVSGSTISVSSILKWYGEDFVERFAGRGPPTASDVDRAILGLVSEFGPVEAGRLASSGRARVRFLSYDWSLNDVIPR